MSGSSIGKPAVAFYEGWESGRATSAGTSTERTSWRSTPERVRYPASSRWSGRGAGRGAQPNRLRPFPSIRSSAEKTRRTSTGDQRTLHSLRGGDQRRPDQKRALVLSDAYEEKRKPWRTVRRGRFCASRECRSVTVAVLPLGEEGRNRRSRERAGALPPRRVHHLLRSQRSDQAPLSPDG